MFTLRNIRSSSIASCEYLVALIRSQLSHDLIDGSFDVGFVQNNAAVSIRSDEDLCELWDQIHNGKNIMSWCDGMISDKGTRKRKTDTDSDDDLEHKKSKKKRNDDAREDKIEEIIYTQMQYRVWSEMIAGGVHTSQDEPPTTTMFSRCGSGGVKRKSSDVVQAIEKLSDVLSPKAVANTHAVSSNSPNKVIDNRINCYKQLSELRNLKVSGILSEKEYSCEKKAIMTSLMALK